MITPKIPPKKPRYRGLLWKILIFDILMRLTPPLTFIALSVTGVALYKAAPADTKTKAKATFNSLRSKLSDWIKPEEKEEEEMDEYDFDENGEMEQEAKERQDKADLDPPPIH